MEIAGSYAEVLALLERLRGRYEHPSIHRVGAILIALFMAVSMAWGGYMSFREGPMLLAIVMIPFGLFVAGAFLTENFATFEITPRGIEKTLPFRGLVWRIAPGEIRSVEVKMGRGWYVRIKTDSGTKMISLFGALKTALVPH
jgi:hypothetical protein